MNSCAAAVRAALVEVGASEEAADKAVAYAAKNALGDTDRTTFQAMEALVHNLNTMHSRAGAQTPFSSVNYGMDTSPEGRMVVKNMLLATEGGLGSGETPIFPVQIFRVKEGVNYNPEDPNYDLFKLAMHCSAKRLFPNFSFIDAPFNAQYYKGTPETEIAEAVQVMRSGTTSNAVYWFKTAMAKYPRQMERFFGSSYAAVSRLYYAMQGTLNVADDSELPTYDAKQLLKTYKKDGILIFTDEASALMTEGSMASELQAQLDKQKYGENEDPQRVCAIGAVYGTWSNAGSFTPDDTETAWDADSLTEYLGSDALRGKDMLLALDGEDSPYLTENCLLKDTDIPVAEQVQKLFVLDKNNMASPESAESE